MFYPLPSDKNYCDNDSTDSRQALEQPKNLYLFNKVNSFLSEINNTLENRFN